MRCLDDPTGLPPALCRSKWGVGKIMINRRMFVAAGFAAVIVLGAGGVRADDAVAARAFIDELADKAIAALTVKDISQEERFRRFRVLLNEHFAVKTIGQWVLGRHWRRASTEERQEYLNLFEDLIVDTYADRFKRYSGDKLDITDAVPRGKKDTIVSTLISRPDGGPPINVDWRVRHVRDIMRIVDVIVEGVSMGQTQRSEFASVIRANGGGVKGLLDQLRKRAPG
jgi:phospholipid transport system substrate-binding protein